jgi:hypothetical protein
MSRISAIAAAALMIVGFAPTFVPAFAEERSILELHQPLKMRPAEPASFAEVSDVGPMVSEPLLVEPAEMRPVADEPYSSTCSCCDSGQFNDCDCCSAECCGVESHPGWRYDLGISALKSHMATSEQSSWPDDVGPAGRVGIGYEWENGFGIRTEAWTYRVKGDLKTQTSLSSYPYYSSYDPYFYSYSSYLYDYSDLHYFIVPGALNQPLYAQSYAFTQPIELSASTVYLDFSKSFYSRHGEFELGMGPAYGHLAFKFPAVHDGTTYDGGGISVYGEGYVPIVERNRWEVALTGQTRAALLTGNWGVAAFSTGEEHSQSMSILELRVGPELRYRTGSTDDRYLFLRTVAEFQQWRSDRMGPVAGDTLGLQGASMDFGILW